MSGQARVTQRRKRRRASSPRLRGEAPIALPVGDALTSPAAPRANPGLAVLRRPAMAMLALLLAAFLLRALWLD
jgi:hypothetical protein